jgi:hypothetical protein
LAVLFVVGRFYDVETQAVASSRREKRGDRKKLFESFGTIEDP